MRTCLKQQGEVTCCADEGKGSESVERETAAEAGSAAICQEIDVTDQESDSACLVTYGYDETSVNCNG